MFKIINFFQNSCFSVKEKLLCHENSFQTLNFIYRSEYIICRGIFFSYIYMCCVFHICMLILSVYGQLTLLPGYYNGYFPTPLYLVITTEFSDWLWEHIFASFPRKKEGNGSQGTLENLLSGKTVAIYDRPYKKNQNHTKFGIENFLS